MKRAFNPYEGIEVEDAWFVLFLQRCAFEVGGTVEQIHGHFRNGGINFRAAEGEEGEEGRSEGEVSGHFNSSG